MGGEFGYGVVFVVVIVGLILVMGGFLGLILVVRKFVFFGYGLV